MMTSDAKIRAALAEAGAEFLIQKLNPLGWLRGGGAVAGGHP
jgi:hypothetical protein